MIDNEKHCLSQMEHEQQKLPSLRFGQGVLIRHFVSFRSEDCCQELNNDPSVKPKKNTFLMPSNRHAQHALP
jgi:hypothetical protein